MTRDAAPNDRDGVLFYDGMFIFSGRCGFRSVVPEERTALTSSNDAPATMMLRLRPMPSEMAPA